MIADVSDYTGDATSDLLWRETAGEFHGQGDDPRAKGRLSREVFQSPLSTCIESRPCRLWCCRVNPPQRAAIINSTVCDGALPGLNDIANLAGRGALAEHRGWRGRLGSQPANSTSFKVL
jgi:hypothetical protein